MYDVDNSGQGNCMYYAYSISLMYFLKAKNDLKITNDIFNKLKLNDADKIKLNHLLTKAPGNEFTRAEIKETIEPILGRATRNLAAERTKSEFQENDDSSSSSLFTVAQYGIEYYFKSALKEQKSELAFLIQNDFDNPNYTEAEIYRVADIKAGMKDFAKTMIAKFIAEFKDKCTEKLEELNQQKRKMSHIDVQFHQGIILDNILKEKTLEFLLANEEKYLNQYINHLKKQFVWGTEENLMTLHRAMQGERFQGNSLGKIDILYDTEIVLHIHKDGKSSHFQAGEPEMIVNNQRNAHWTSQIPQNIFGVKHTPSKLLALEKHDPNPSLEMRLFKINRAICKLKNKIGEVNQHHQPEAYEKAKELLENLKRFQAEYKDDMELNGINAKDNNLKFQKNCMNSISTVKPILERDLGWGDFLTNLLKSLGNDLVFVASLGFAKDSFFTLERSRSLIAVEKVEKHLNFGLQN